MSEPTTLHEWQWTPPGSEPRTYRLLSNGEIEEESRDDHKQRHVGTLWSDRAVVAALTKRCADAVSLAGFLGAARATIGRLDTEADQLRADLAASRERVAALEGALRKHGLHFDTCELVLLRPFGEQAACTCGLAAALGEEAKDG